MLLPCKDCCLVNEPYSVTPSENPALVRARYACKGCGRRYRELWTFASFHFWEKTGGTLAAEDPLPIQTGVEVIHPSGREPGSRGQSR